jgi:hypothetical protein
MPFTRTGPDSYTSPSGRKFNKKQVQLYYATDGFKQKPTPSLQPNPPSGRPHGMPAGYNPTQQNVMPASPASPYGQLAPDPTNFNSAQARNSIVPPGLTSRFNIPAAHKRRGVEGPSGPRPGPGVSLPNKSSGPAISNQSVYGHASGSAPKRATKGMRNIAEPATAKRSKVRSIPHGSILPRGLY